MKRQKREIRPVTHRRTGFLFRVLTMAAVALAAACCLTLFFQVEEIKVRGNSMYTAEEIAGASGISTGDNMVSIQKANAASLIRSTLPFVSSVHIERTLPGTVEITVTESDVTFAVCAQDQSWYLMGSDGVLTEEIQTVHAPDYPNVKGITVLDPKAGSVITVSEGQTQNKAVALTLVDLLSRYGLAGATEVIDVSETHNILLQYGSQYDVQLGTSENLSYKIEYLASVLQQLESEGYAKDALIDLTFTEENAARVDPY